MGMTEEGRAVLDPFDSHRGNLGRVYELLRVAEAQTLPRTRLWQAANYNPQRGLNYIFHWLWERGLIERVEYKDIKKAYTYSQRRPPANSKGLFKITDKGREVIRVYDALFDIMGLSDKVRARFPKDEGGVKTHLASGQKVRM